MTTLIVDLDGTLINSKKRHIEVLKFVLQQNNLKYDDLDDFVCYKTSGKTTLDYLSNNLKLSEKTSKKIFQEWINHIEDRIFMRLDKWYPDTLKFITESYNTHSIIILTARNNKNFTMEFLNSSKIAKYIEGIYIVNPKNALNEKNKVIHKFVNPILIGDTEIEYKLSKANNCKSYILNRGFRSKEFFNQYQIETYSDLNELLSVLE